MLAIRMQRTGRKGHAQYRVVVQDARLSPTSGRVVANIGNYNPHTKALTIDAEKATKYLSNGAQPSPRVVKLLQAEGVTLPKWVRTATVKQRSLRNPDKLRRNRPADTEPKADAEPAEEPAPAPAEEAPATEEVAPQETTAPEPAAEAETAASDESDKPAEE